MTPYLSKSKLMSFLQCPRRLYLEVKHPELAVPSPDTGALMTTGNRVGEIARKLFPAGVLIQNQDHLAAAVRATARQMAAQPRVPLFEGTFRHQGTLVRADVLLPYKKSRARRSRR